MKLRPWIFSALLLGFLTESIAEAPASLFKEVAATRGLVFKHESGALGEKHLPETMGSGVAWLDYDQDGDLDLYVVQSGPFPPSTSTTLSNELFRNDNGFFSKVENAAGANDTGYGQGVLTADLSGDGLVDLYITNFGPDRYYQNNGDGTFTDKTKSSGLVLSGWGSSIAAADLERDGDLDLYVVRYLEYDPTNPTYCTEPETQERRYCDPTLFAGAEDVLFINQGEGIFSRAETLVEADGKGLGVLWVDLNQDGFPDIYVANDLTANALYENLNGTLTPISWLSGAAVNISGKAEAGMGLAVGDVDSDQDPDLVVSNFDVETNTLYRNDGAFNFQDVSAPSGFGPPSFNHLGFGMALEDFNADGTLDAYITNGHIFTNPRRENSPHAQPDLFLLGDGAGGFVNATAQALSVTPAVGRGLAVGDFDNDGDADLAISNNNGPLHLLENQKNPGSWFGIQLQGSSPNQEAIGARITLLDASQKPLSTRWITAGDSYLSTSDKRLRFFHQPGWNYPLSLQVLWPDGEETSASIEAMTNEYSVLSKEGLRAATYTAANPAGRPTTEGSKKRGAVPKPLLVTVLLVLLISAVWVFMKRR